MRRIYSAFLSSYLPYGIVATLLGAMLSHASWGLALGTLFWALVQLRRFNTLLTWLHNDTQDEPPDLEGLWGDLLDEIIKRKKRSQNREAGLQRVMNRFQQSVSALPDAMVIIDASNNLEWWNQASEELLGLRERDQGKPLLNLLRDPRFVRYFRKRNYQEPLQLKSPYKHDLTLQYQISYFGEGDRVLVARDVTRLLKLEQTRQDFVANASHELRTPLTVIRGYVETLLDQEQPRPMQRALSQMLQQSLRMESLVADLLLLSRLESTTHINEEKPIAIQAMIEQIHHDAVALSGERQHRFELQVDQTHDLAGQPLELTSAFSNLVFNAVRYTPAEGTICIGWRVDEQGGHFFVRDNGIGIASMHLPRLTERFYRVDESRSSASGGTGLGLAIVKHVLMRHGAHLNIQSQVGQGSTFTCNFPPDMVRPLLSAEPSSAAG